MSDQRGPMNHLNIIEQRANAATEGPWEMYRPHHASGFHSITGGTGGTDNLADDVSEANAEFIAHARDDVPKLVAALKAVLAMHSEEHQHYSPFVGSTVVTCFACGEPTPCPTVRTITKALEVEL